VYEQYYADDIDAKTDHSFDEDPIRDTHTNIKIEVEPSSHINDTSTPARSARDNASSAKDDNDATIPYPARNPIVHLTQTLRSCNICNRAKDSIRNSLKPSAYPTLTS